MGNLWEGGGSATEGCCVHCVLSQLFGQDRRRQPSPRERRTFLIDVQDCGHQDSESMATSVFGRF